MSLLRFVNRFNCPDQGNTPKPPPQSTNPILKEDKIMSYRSVSPYSGKILKTFDELTDKQLESALEAAESCFQAWRQTTFAERAVVVAKAAALMRKHSDELAGFVTLEMGKLIEQARGEVALSADTGMVFVNHPTWTTPDLPFGGIKNSGYGRELSSLGIQEFVNKKLVRVTSIDSPS